jgi:hypothetical protein
MIYGLAGSSAGLACFWWRRIRIAEHGLVVRSKFIPWDKCFRWYWDACNKNVVVINCAPRLHLALIVPAEARSIVNEILSENLVPRSFDELPRTKR